MLLNGNTCLILNPKSFFTNKNYRRKFFRIGGSAINHRKNEIDFIIVNVTLENGTLGVWIIPGSEAESNTVKTYVFYLPDPTTPVRESIFKSRFEKYFNAWHLLK